MFITFLVICLLFIFIFIFLTANLGQKWLVNIDLDFTKYLATHKRNQFKNIFFKYIDKVFILCVIGVILTTFYRLTKIEFYPSIITTFNKLSLKIFLPWITVALIVVLIKRLIRRSRPHYMPLKVYTDNSFSFPSLHAASSIVIALGILNVLLSYSSYFNSSIIGIILLITTLTASHILVCYSRVYLGVHYLSDVVAGTTVGFVVYGLFIRL